MEFSSGRARLRHARLAGDRRELYPHSLQFYQEPPAESVSLAEFESFAVDRLRLLKIVENLGVSYVRSGDMYKNKLEQELRKLKFPYRALAEDDYDARRKDHISHFILRLAYCQSEDLRRWFLQQEMDLFRYRFNELNDSLRQKFLEHVNLSFEAISEDLKNEWANDLCASTPGLSMIKVKEQMFYKVGLSDAVELFRARRVFIKDGFAYVPLKDIDAIVLNNYRTKLSKALASEDSPVNIWISIADPELQISIRVVLNCILHKEGLPQEKSEAEQKGEGGRRSCGIVGWDSPL
ncbi:DNA primase large subunit isoform X2 [Apteryx rowi]|uniref:DNA primase large subunit isoform X2 n=1 Tax=Apteryx rowi TaxID=308060 RepID=UPI000E1C40A6|nr:DNA primase large subunit isoform X2 [Apteryx rowi]